MVTDVFTRAKKQIQSIRLTDPVGRVSEVGSATIRIEVATQVHLGDRAEVIAPGARCVGEVIRVYPGGAEVLPEGDTQGICVDTVVRLFPPPGFAPDDSWIGRVIDPDGRPLDGRPLMPGSQARRLRQPPPPPQTRRHWGARMPTGFAVFDTLLPLARGQRLGLFAGSGVGKSTLLGELARVVEADVIVIGLVGERGRELRDFVDNVLGPEGLKRSVVLAATSDRAPQVRRRSAWAATAVAEHFRDQGKQVLLLIDSITRFAEAHRELAVAAGEPANLRGFPASTGPAIASLCERSGPGSEGTGDITAIFSVLVAGSDMEEPVADMLRGVLDGHVVLDRAIAERGRFPAVDLLRSVSRCLPDVATEEENRLIGQARRELGTYDRSELMIQAGLYSKGSDPELDRAIQTHPKIDAFLARREPGGVEASFAHLRAALA